jgi:hypothetical protein
LLLHKSAVRPLLPTSHSMQVVDHLLIPGPAVYVLTHELAFHISQTHVMGHIRAACTTTRVAGVQPRVPSITDPGGILTGR